MLGRAAEDTKLGEAAKLQIRGVGPSTLNSCSGQGPLKISSSLLYEAVPSWGSGDFNIFIISIQSSSSAL